MTHCKRQTLKILKKFGFDSLEEFKANFVDKDDYIELKKAIGGITMFQKYAQEKTDWYHAMEYAENLNLGGFNNWRLPLKKELKTLFKLMKLLRVTEPYGYLWASDTVTDQLDTAWVVNLSEGRAYKDIKGYEDEYCTRCVRVTAEEEKFHEKERKRLEKTRIKAALRLGREFGFKSGEEFIENFVDKGDYIELKKAIGGITMFDKDCWKCMSWMSWNDALEYAESLEVGGFNDWRLPTREELVIIRKIRCFLEIEIEHTFWSSNSVEGNEKCAWTVNLYLEKSEPVSKSCGELVCCVRITKEEEKLHEEEKSALEEVRKERIKELLTETGFSTVEEFVNNISETDDYIEFKEPVGGVKMIQKGSSEEKLCWLDGAKYAENLKLGGFNDWRLPTTGEIKIMYYASVLAGIKWKNGLIWSSSPNDKYRDEAWAALANADHFEYYRKSFEFYVRCVRVTEEREHFHEREKAALLEEKTEIRKPVFIREKVDKRHSSEDTIFFLTVGEKDTGLPMDIMLDEASTHIEQNHTPWIKLHIGYFRKIKDSHDFAHVDMEGNVYTQSQECEDRWSLKYEDYLALKNFLHNNRYAIEKMAEQKVGDDICDYLIKGGEIASEERIKELEEKTDSLLWKWEIRNKKK